MAKLNDLALRCLQNCCTELHALLPFFDAAFAALPPLPGKTATIGTDTQHLLFSPRFLLQTYSCNPAALRRGILHILLHCLFLHPFRNDPDLCWHVACDMAVEQIIAREDLPRLTVEENITRRQCMAILGTQPRPAEEIAAMLRSGRFPLPLSHMAEAFAFDDHSLWSSAPCSGKDRWKKLLAYTNENRANHRRGTRAGQGSESLDPPGPGPYDYRTFLRRFSVPREELALDCDSFDYIYYTLGMAHSGLVLLEPLEYKEGHKLEELVIAIDTSGSCSRETVQAFLADTYRILSERENFFSRMCVHLIQCDCLVQRSAVIRSAEEWHNYARTITIEGRGGTDFTPVFRYVAEQRRAGRLQKLKALLYFTDGDGFYPREATDYETAFVFLERTEHMDAVPPWATKLLVR